MPSPSRFTRVKITVGYIALLSIIFFSLFFINREIQNLSVLDTEQLLKADSLLVLLRQKDENTINMLRALSEANERLLSMDELESIIAREDTLITQQRVQHRVVATRDSVLAPAPKKSFFRRLGEAFVPPKDTVVVLNTTLEVTTDTLLNEYNPVDSLQQRIREISLQRRADQQTALQRNNARMRRMNNMLTARIDSLVSRYQDEIILQATQEAESQRELRRRSTLILGGVAVGAIILSAIFLIIILRDISRSNRYRSELEAANKRAEDLLKARENLMLTITHDFKAPLSSIIGYIDLLSGARGDEDKQKTYLTNMKSSSDHLLKLVSDLLDFHRLDLNKVEINRKKFNPVRLFEEIRISFEPLTAAKGLAFRYEITPDLDGNYIGDSLRIRQIVNNLLSNAIKFTPAGSVSLLVSYASSRLTIAIADTGKGMEPEDKERIFQEFTRLSGAQGEEGFGLGLSIVRKLVQLLEGTVQVFSVPGKGSIFTVILPLFPVPGKGFKEEIQPSPSPETNVRPLRILLIDDDKIQLQLTSAMLEQAGMNAVGCDQLDALIENLRNETFDVLLTDVQMPAINGFDLLRLLRSSNIPQAQTIPVIAVTARSEISVDEFRSHGFAGYLNKPFSVNDLLEAVGITGIAGNKPVEAISNRLDFSALTAFSEGDEIASKNIIQSFIVETGRNIEALKQILSDRNVDGIAALAHKLLPLFTMIQAKEVIPLLKDMEAKRGEEFSVDIEMKTKEVIELIEEIIAEAAKLYE